MLSEVKKGTEVHHAFCEYVVCEYFHIMHFVEKNSCQEALISTSLKTGHQLLWSTRCSMSMKGQDGNRGMEPNLYLGSLENSLRV